MKQTNACHTVPGCFMSRNTSWCFLLCGGDTHKPIVQPTAGAPADTRAPYPACFLTQWIHCFSGTIQRGQRGGKTSQRMGLAPWHKTAGTRILAERHRHISPSTAERKRWVVKMDFIKTECFQPPFWYFSYCCFWWLEDVPSMSRSVLHRQ